MAEFLRIAWTTPIYWSRGSLENFCRGMRDIGSPHIGVYENEYFTEEARKINRSLGLLGE